ncbi:hypothetical protein M513_08038 [Trichuris suis]|uniref:Uncharacterized protein n=1 Tax=Trichuris suis TaxID=68888 RepID=A0A085M1P2_9BILA|nr:hypothetical protein M513_08038 [Trichuris suis]
MKECAYEQQIIGRSITIQLKRASTVEQSVRVQSPSFTIHKICVHKAITSILSGLGEVLSDNFDNPEDRPCSDILVWEHENIECSFGDKV